MRKFFENSCYWFNTLFIIADNIFGEKPIYNEDFVNKFTDPEDQKKLNEAIQELKNTQSSETTITLNNNEDVTIVLR